jgi:FKBP-type peptidyl-prolyl cis-trans isomerase FklB
MRGIILLLLILSFTSCEGGKKTSKGDEKTASDTVVKNVEDKPEPAAKLSEISYVRGLEIGRMLMVQTRGREGEFVLEEFVKGIEHYMKSEKLKLSPEKIQKLLKELLEQGTEAQKKMIEEFTAKHLKLVAGFLAEVKSKKGIKVSKKGLNYKVLKVGKGKATKDKTAIVHMHLRGFTAAGKLFNSSFAQDEPDVLDMPFVTPILRLPIPGLQDVLTEMKEGDKWMIEIPAAESGAGAQSQGTDLVFIVELLKVETQ